MQWKGTDMWQFLKSLFAKPPEELVVAHNLMKKNMRYVSQPSEWANGKVLKVWPLETPFEGDCDDAAASVAYRVGGEFWIIEEGKHAVCQYKGWISDDNYFFPYPAGKMTPVVVVPMGIGSAALRARLGFKVEVMGFEGVSKPVRKTKKG